MEMPRLSEDRQKLAEDNIALAYWVVRAYQKKYGSKYHDDIESGGLYGLTIAARDYDESKGFSFATYARKTISGWVRNTLRESTVPKGYRKLRDQSERRKRKYHAVERAAEEIPQFEAYSDADSVPLTEKNFDAGFADIEIADEIRVIGKALTPAQKKLIGDLLGNASNRKYRSYTESIGRSHNLVDVTLREAARRIRATMPPDWIERRVEGLGSFSRDIRRGQREVTAGR